MACIDLANITHSFPMLHLPCECPRISTQILDEFYLRVVKSSQSLLSPSAFELEGETMPWG